MSYTRRQMGGMLATCIALPAACQSRPRPRIVHGIAGQGQSNMVGELDFGQLHRIPDSYDPARDGPARISAAGAGVFTPAGATVVPLAAGGAVDGARRYGDTAAETPMFGFCAQLLRADPERQLCVSVAGAQGASPLSVLRRPTRDEIAAGVMIASDRRMPVPPDSLEAVSLRDGLGLRELWRSPAVPATPWFRDARAQSVATEYFRRNGQQYMVAYMPMQHGETLPEEPYLDALCAFYDEKQTCWHEITGQTAAATMILELANYAPMHETPGAPGYERWKAAGRTAATAPGGPDTLYASDGERFNFLFRRNLEQVAAVGRGGRRIRVSGPKYPHSSLIHHDQYGSRWAGEVMGCHAGDTRGALLAPIRVERDQATLVLTFDRQIQFRAPANGATHEIRPGLPYGIGLFARDGRMLPLPLSAVRIDTTARRIAIALPGDAHRVEYCSQARIGSICGTEPLPIIARDRGGAMLPSFDYCCPFTADIPAGQTGNPL